MTEFDYRDLLVRYIALVEECEGVTFIDRADMRGRFTDEEIVEMQLLEAEALAEGDQ